MRLTLIVICGVFLLGCQSGLKPFYPLGIYSPGVAANLPEIRAAGFNLVVGDAREEFLRSARLNNLRVLASIGTAPGSSFSAAQSEAIIRRFDSNPQVWA